MLLRVFIALANLHGAAARSPVTATRHRVDAFSDPRQLCCASAHATASWPSAAVRAVRHCTPRLRDQAAAASVEFV